MSYENQPESYQQSPDAVVGRVLNVYRVLKKLGEGGVGGVYLAEHVDLGRTVALKVLLPEHTRGARAVQEFLDEARMAARLGHENIIDISYGGQSPDGLAFLAMEYLSGEDLGHLLRREGAMSWERARPIFLQIASALAAVHKQGIVHADIKPDNVFLTIREGRRDFVKVLDFGVSKALGAPDRIPRSVSGTPQYMSPEQTLGQRLDPRSDIYSFGCVMYQTLTGTLPFQADSIIDLMAKHNYEAPVPPRTRRPDLHIPHSVERIVLRAMEKDVAQRYQSMEEMSEAMARVRLTAAAEGMPSSEPLRIDDPRLRAAKRWRLVRAWSVFAAGAIAFCAVAYEMTREKTPAVVGVGVAPVEASIFVDGKKVGEGRFTLAKIRPGRHYVWAEAPGYLRQQQELLLEEGQGLEVKLNLPLSPASGIEVTSDPPDVPIWLDGAPLLRGESDQQARTPYVARRLRPGQHQVEARHGNQIWRYTVLVEPDRVSTVHAQFPTLEKRPPTATGRPRSSKAPRSSLQGR